MQAPWRHPRAGTDATAGRPEQPATDGALQSAEAGRWLIAIVGAAALLGAIYISLVLPGTASDEPAHLNNVGHYSRSIALPVLGTSGTNYEAQQPPLYYLAAGSVLRALPSARFTLDVAALRALNLLLGLAVILATYWLATLATRGRRDVALLAAVFVALNPTLLAINSSVQNDTVAILLATLAIVLGLRIAQLRLTGWLPELALGTLAGAAILAKPSTVFLPASLAIGLIVVGGRTMLRTAVVAVVVSAAAVTWWFVRNASVYGDYTAHDAMTRFYPTANPPPIALWRPSVLGHWMVEIVSYLWSPAEYFRNVYHQPVWYRALVLLIVGVAGLGLALLGMTVGHGLWKGIRARGAKSALASLWASPRARTWIYLLVQFTGGLAFYAYSSARVTYFAPRVAFSIIAILAILTAVGWYEVLIRRLHLPGWVVIAGISGLLVVLNATQFRDLRGLPTYPFNVTSFTGSG